MDVDLILLVNNGGNGHGLVHSQRIKVIKNGLLLALMCHHPLNDWAKIFLG